MEGGREGEQKQLNADIAFTVHALSFSLSLCLCLSISISLPSPSPPSSLHPCRISLAFVFFLSQTEPFCLTSEQTQTEKRSLHTSTSNI